MRARDGRIERHLADPTRIGKLPSPSSKSEPFAGSLHECEIEWPPSGSLRARRIVSRSRCIATGKSQSLTLGRPTHWESEVERDGQKLVDACRAVRAYGEQPFTIHYRTSSGWHRHVPDLFVNGVMPQPWIIEFKRDDDSELEAARQRADLLAPALRQAGYQYFVVLGSTLRRCSYLKNAKWLLRYGRGCCSLIDLERVRRLYDRTSSLHLNQLGEAFASTREGWCLTARLILDGYLQVDMRLPIDERAEITWSQEPSIEGDISWLRAAFGVTK